MDPNQPNLETDQSGSTTRGVSGGAYFFLTFVFIGAVVFLARSFFAQESSQGVRNVLFGLPPVLVLLFWMIGSWLGFAGKAESRQRFADNIYFLGFIFTMGALIASFLPVAVANGNVSPQEIYEAFGTALLSTALGLIFRVVVMQLAPSSDEAAAQMEEDLTALTRRVAAEAKGIGDDLATARRGLVKHNEAMVKAVLGATGKRLEAVVSEFDDAAKATTGLLAAQAEQTRTEAEALRQRVAVRANDIVEAARLMAEARERMGGAMAGLAEPVARLGTELEATQKAANETAQKLRNDVAQLAAALTAAVSGTERMASALSEFQVGAVGQLGRVNSAVGALEATTNRAAVQVEAAATESAEQLARAGASLVGEAQGLGQQAGDFQSALDQAMASFAAVVSSFADELDRLRSTVEPTQPTAVLPQYGQAE
ncbi:hypothetical protein [Sandarakinorhabdus sp.]|uniref:hypothetical protein n=1 Tax=Sandarakinorhabdus sp. TaxID=1916663 RepID=UPI003F6F6813